MTKKLPIIGQSTAAPAAANGAASDPSAPAAAGGAAGGRVALVTLGCAKNQVDSEVMLGALRQGGYEIVTDLALAEYAVINTCGFLESAVKESVDCILEVADLKKSARLRKLVVAGCMVSRYGEELRGTLPEVDEFLSTDQIMQAPSVLRGAGVGAAQAPFLYDHSMPRLLSTAAHTAYVKIAEGCNRPCSFCIIPKIRGPMRSRASQSVLAEIGGLAAQGVREINLIGQDLTAYGRDRRDIALAQLLREIDALDAVPWVRLLYAYPVGVDDELLRTIIDTPSICNYLDIPLQHASETVLKAMQRPLGKLAPRRLVEKLREGYPEVALRTTFIVGFPGEREEDFRELEDFVAEGHFSSVGVFTFSPEQEAPASGLPHPVSKKVMRERRDRLMRRQQEVVKQRHQALVGSDLEVLIDGTHEESDLLLSGRARFQAPEVDGGIIINDSCVDPAVLRAGAIARVEITGHAGYDLLGTVREVIAT